MEKSFKKLSLLLLAVAAVVLLIGGALGIDIIQANQNNSYRVRRAPTSIRTVVTNPTVGEIRIEGAIFERASAAVPTEVSGWTWMRGTLITPPGGSDATTTATNGVNYNGRLVWISTSQLGHVAHENGNSTHGVCNIVRGDTALRHAPNNGINGTVARLPNSGGSFHLIDNRVVTNGGFRWRLGTIRGTNGQVTATNGTFWGHRIMWVATSQLTNNSTCQ